MQPLKKQYPESEHDAQKSELGCSTTATNKLFEIVTDWQDQKHASVIDFKFTYMRTYQNNISYLIWKTCHTKKWSTSTHERVHKNNIVSVVKDPGGPALPSFSPLSLLLFELSFC